MTKSEQKKKVLISRSLLLTLVLGAFSLGIFMGAGTLGLFTAVQADKGENFTGNREEEFRFIRTSTIPHDFAAGPHNKELRPFRYKVDAFIQDKLAKGEASAISFYFRDLMNGNRFGIRESEKFSPKSLLKVPLMIAYFKWAETNPLVLRKILTGKKIENVAEEKHIKPLTELEPGKHYTVNDLIFRMIAYDDTRAYSLLFENLPPGRLDKIFKDLNVDYDPQKNNTREDFLSLTAFASFYRVLFNASYLSEEMSEKALRYLSKSVFRDGIASAVPQNIEVAGKEGEQTIPIIVDGEKEDICQVHEFAIVYHSSRPFLIGVMVQGEDFNASVKVIRDLARLVYEEVDQQT